MIKIEPTTWAGIKASEILTGTLLHERGGLEADVSAYSGVIKITGGATSEATIGIADNNIVEIDSSDVAADRYARFTANGLDGRTAAEVLSDIGAGAGDVTAGANITANSIVIGDDGAKGIKLSTGFITDAGEAYNASQPAFLAYNSSADANETGDGTLATVDFDTEVFDQGGDFATDTFTAPVDGRYQLNSAVFIYDLSSDTFETVFIELLLSNRAYRSDIGAGTSGSYNATGELSLSIGALVDMDANDTAVIRVYVTGGTKTVDILGSGTLYTYFSGALLC